MPELLSPAGNREKMEAAIRYGADAVYLAGKMFGMRSAADNFSLEELSSAIDYAHRHGVKVYLTVNTMPRQTEYTALREYLERIRPMHPDALIVADLGVISLAKQIAPEIELHISTQANIVSAETCRAYHALGAKRVVLARELTLEEIRAIRRDIPDTLELEAFIHGSMCISYSGRCLLSGFFTGRDGNRGACAQPCRWHYQMLSAEVIEEKRPHMPLTIQQIEGESFIMSSRDTCMIEHIPELMESGIDSFKLEGRMKSAYYTAVVTNTYRMAMDAYQKGGYQYDPAWLRELQSVSHREYATGYYFHHSDQEANTCKEDGYIREKAYLGVALAYDEKTGEGLFMQKNKVCCGDAVELLTPGKTGQWAVAEQLFDKEHQPIESAPHPFMQFYVKLPFPVKPGDILRAGDKRTTDREGEQK